MKRGMIFLGVVVVLLIGSASLIMANSLSVEIPSPPMSVGENFDVNIVGSTTTDLHSIGFDITYDNSILTLNSISEGTFLNESGAVTTLFNYSSFGSGLANNIFVARNTTWQDPNPGVTGTGVIATLNFIVAAEGTSDIGITDEIWINSSITNDSVSLETPTITNGSVTINSAASCTFTDANWTQTNVVEGTLVTLNVYGTNCNGEEVNFTIWEDDGILADDPVNINPANEFFSGNSASATWIAEFQDDQAGDPEYYFDAYIVSTPSETVSSSNQLSVSELITTNEVVLIPRATQVDQGDWFEVEVHARAPVGSSDIYGLQFDLTYPNSAVVLNSIQEGSMLNEGGSVQTIFNYTLSSGLVDNIYNVRNITFAGANVGLYQDDGVVAVINFTAVTPGVDYDINLSDVLWVNSTITESNVGIPGVFVENATVNIQGTGNLNPLVSSIQCNIDGTWQSCDGLDYGEQLREMRADCTDSDNGVESVYFELKNIEDGSVLVDGYGSQNVDTWTLDHGNFNLNDSGSMELTVTCTDLNVLPGLNVTTIPWFVPWGNVSSTITFPSALETNVSQYNEFAFDTTVSCSLGECGNVSANLNPVLTSVGAVPFYTLDSNPQYCLNMKLGDNCPVVWTVNSTGSIGSTHTLNVSFNSNYGVTNQSENRFVTINDSYQGSSGSEIIIFDDDFQGTASSSAFARTTNNPAQGTHNLETTLAGGWQSSFINNINIPVASIDWANSNLTFFIQSPGADSFQLTIRNELNNEFHYYPTSPIGGYIYVNVPLSAFGFSGNTFADMYLDDNWPAGTLYVDEVKIVESGPPVDIQPPTFDNLADQGLVEGQSLYYDIDATDAEGNLDGFSINDTVNFNIDYKTGVVTNVTSMSIGTYVLEVTINDTFGNSNVGVFNVVVSSDDFTPPVRSNPQPDVNLPSGTEQVNINLTTDENANCRYSLTAAVPYSSMANTFTTTGGTFHNQLITGLSDGETRVYNVRCQDTSPNWNTNTNDFYITVTVEQGATCTDGDGDLYSAEADPASCGGFCFGGAACLGGGDCNDGDASINPLATEICTDGVDNNCNDESDFDDSDGLRGDGACVVNIINAVANKYFLEEGEEFQIGCFTDIGSIPINSVDVEVVGESSCLFDHFEGTGAYFFNCSAGPYTGVNKTVNCSINQSITYSNVGNWDLEVEILQNFGCVDPDTDGYDNCTLAQGGDGQDVVDCDNGDGSVYPGAPEICDNQDNDCSAGYVDGEDECGGLTPYCDSGIPSCVECMLESQCGVDAWATNGTTFWNQTDACTEELVEGQDFTDYSCSAGACTSAVTQTQWVDTGSFNYEPPSTICNANYLCSDSFGLDNAYGQPDQTNPSMGYCDGAGSCDYSDNTGACTLSSTSNSEGTGQTMCVDGNANCVDTCSDGVDNDGNSCTDSEDYQCGGGEAGSCSDFVDNDCDGLTDAADPDCFTCTPGNTQACGSGACSGTQTCNAGGTWDDCTTRNTNSCGSCCVCENNNNPNPVEDLTYTSECSPFVCDSLDTSCADYNDVSYCVGINSCADEISECNDITYASQGTLCDSNYLCSNTGGGSGAYNSGDFFFPSQGLCDGFGSCDYASTGVANCDFNEGATGTQEGGLTTICVDGASTCTDTCSDGVDNDLNGCFDSSDYQCGGVEDCLTPGDDDCDGFTNYADLTDCVMACTDNDNDGHYAIDAINCPVGDDCDDSDGFTYPGANENCTDGVDNQCGSAESGYGLIDCADSFCSSNPVCNLGSCSVVNMQWNQTSANEDDPIELIVDTANCDTLPATFYIFEDDAFVGEFTGDDSVIIPPMPTSTVVTSDQAISYWTAEWQDDGFFEFTSSPEYYFIVEIGGTNYSSKDFGPHLEVSLSERSWELFDIPLKNGRNSLSLPLFLDNYSIDYVFRDIISNVVMIYSYDERFKVRHFVGNAPSNLDDLEVGKGYIVIMNSDATLTINGTKRDENLERPIIALVPGWNFIGTFSNNYEAQQIFSDVTYTELYTYNETTGTYDSVPADTYLEGDRGYWIYVDESASFIPLTGQIINNDD